MALLELLKMMNLDGEKVRITWRASTTADNSAVKTEATLQRLPLQLNRGKTTPKPTPALDSEP